MFLLMSFHIVCYVFVFVVLWKYKTYGTSTVDYAKTQVYIVSHLEYHSQINLRRATIPTRVQYVELYQERITGMYRT